MLVTVTRHQARLAAVCGLRCQLEVLGHKNVRDEVRGSELQTLQDTLVAGFSA